MTDRSPLTLAAARAAIEEILSAIPDDELPEFDRLDDNADGTTIAWYAGTGYHLGSATTTGVRNPLAYRTNGSWEAVVGEMLYRADSARLANGDTSVSRPAATEPSFDALAALVGELPEGDPPGAWWTSTDPDVISEFDAFLAVDNAYQDRVRAALTELGVETAMTSAFDGTVIGFLPTPGMQRPAGHADHIPVPDGWRIDSKSGYLVPLRRTKADRENAANALLTELNAHASPPEPTLTGMPEGLRLPGRRYWTQFRGGAACVLAFLGADPDRAKSPSAFDVDTRRWTRRSLSDFHRLHEMSATTTAAETA